MRNKLTIALLFCFCAVAVAQETKFYKKSIDVDSIISIRGDGFGLRKYLANNLKYPMDAATKSIMGTYIGGIRIDNKGNLIKVFTVNSLCKTIDDGFIEIIKMAWKKNDVFVSNISDTTDVFISIQYKILGETSTKPYEYYVDSIPKFVSGGIGVVASFQTKIVYSPIPTVSGSPNLTTSFSGPIATVPGSTSLTTSAFGGIATFSTSFNSTKITDDKELIDKANKNFKNRKFDKCINPLNELIRRNPYNADIIRMRGVCYNKLQKYDLENRDYNYLRFFLENDKYKKLRITE